MPISINGSGIITGANTSNFFTANSITTNLLANNSVTFDKLGTTSRIIKFTQLTNNTRTSWSDSADYVFWSAAYNKERSDSSLFVQASISTYGTYSYCYSFYARYAGGTYYQGTLPNVASSVGYCMRQSTEFLIIGTTNTGVNNIDVKWNVVNGATGNKPAYIWNPNASDEARLAQQFSSLNVWEYV